MDLVKNYLEVVVLVAGIIGVIIRTAQIKADIYTAIDTVKDENNLKIVDIKSTISELKHDLAIHITEYSVRKESYDYRFHGLEETLKHKFQRCWERLEESSRLLDELKITTVNQSNEIKSLQKLTEE